MRKTITLALLMLVGLALPAAAQTADQKTVQQAVESFLLRLGDHQYDSLAAGFTEKGLIVITRQREPQWVTTTQTADEWIAALKKNATPVTFREPLTNVKVTIDDAHLAFLRADFQVVRDNKVQSHGVDQFTLVRDAAGWKIAVVAYTSIPEPR
jgi:hypothetical protein